MSNHHQDDTEQPEYQWVEDFFDGMIAIGIALITGFIGVVVLCFTNLFSREGEGPPEESE